jgi:hypothetical protein
MNVNSYILPSGNEDCDYTSPATVILHGDWSNLPFEGMGSKGTQIWNSIFFQNLEILRSLSKNMSIFRFLF